jgi:hypothetical protein
MTLKYQLNSVISTETEIWRHLHTKRRQPLDPQWLFDHYSMDISQELKIIICEKLGHQQDQGWEKIKILIETFGIQRELIQAAGLCHQKEAYHWLLSLIIDQKEEQYYCDIVESLACWGAEIPEQVLTACLMHENPSIQLAGLSMLNFRSYQLSAKELLGYCELALIKNYDALNLEVIRILQRRDEPAISERLFKLCSETSDATAKSALKALGCINTAKSRECLQRLTETLPDSDKKNFAKKQLAQQCLSISQS